MDRKYLLWAIVGTLAWCGATAGAKTIVVKQDATGDATSVQAALNLAAEGDVIEIADDGRYVEDVTVSPVLAQAGLPVPALVSFSLQAAEGKHPVIEAANSETTERMAVLGFPGRDMLGCVIWGCRQVTIRGIEFENPENSVNLYNIASVFALADCADVVVEDCVFRGPGAASPGDAAAVLVAGVQANPFRTDNITFRRCVITGSHYGIISAVFQKGSGVDPGKVTIEECSFIDGFESAVDIDNAGEAIIRDCTFDNYNHGVHLAGGKTTVERCVIKNSKAEGIDADVDENWNDQITGGVIRDCVIIGNGYQNPVAGIRCADGPIQIENCIIAGSWGPGLVVSTGSTTDVAVTVDHCDFYENFGDYEIHIALDGTNAAQLTITNSNIVSSGGGILNEIEEEAVTAHHNNVFVAVDPYIGVTPTESVSVDPMYVSPASEPDSFTVDGFRLKPESPLLSAGEAGTWIGSQGPQVAGVEMWVLR